MTRQRLLVLGGYALIASFLLSLAGGMLHPVVDGRSHSVAALTAPGTPWGQLLIYAGALALMFGLPAAYSWLGPRVGVLGFAGFSLYFLGNALSAQAHLVVEAMVAPEIARRAPELVPDDGSIVASPLFGTVQLTGGLVLMAGLLVMGIALVRQSVVPRWIGATAIAGAVLLATPLPEVAVLTGVQVELLRGITVAALGVYMIRAVRAGRVGAAPAP
ncbi:MAG: hypothetical protein ABW212_02500, partial [Pseudonocardia sediminis]